MTKVKLKKLSVCPCGFPALKDGIDIGDEYAIDVDSIRGGTWMCGGCKRCRPIKMVNTSQRLNPRGPLALLPYELFEVPPEGLQ
jgi:hypothetical protein